MFGADAPDFGAASDGDGDRNMILGRALLRHAVGQPRGARRERDARARLRARARRRRALDADERGRSTSVARALGIECYETPTGLEVLRQPARRGPHHALRRGELRHRLRPRAREGRAVGGALLAQRRRRARRVGRGRSCASTGRASGATTTRGTTTRRSPPTAARGVMDAAARRGCRRCPARRSAAAPSRRPTTSRTPTRSTAARAQRQGLRVLFDGGARIVYRLSGTGTEGATLRIYVESLRARRVAPRRGRAGGAAPADRRGAPARRAPRAHRPRGADGHHLSVARGATSSGPARCGAWSMLYRSVIPRSREVPTVSPAERIDRA